MNRRILSAFNSSRRVLLCPATSIFPSSFSSSSSSFSSFSSFSHSSLLSFSSRKLYSNSFGRSSFCLFVRHNSTSSVGEMTCTLPRDSNQAIGIARYAIDFINGKIGGKIAEEVIEKVKLFHVDSVLCGVSALALSTNAPKILREEALTYPQENGGACVFGSKTRCAPEKAIAANTSAVREWDSNGTVFGFNPNIPGHQAGEFGHNDFYPVVVAAAQANPTIDGMKAVRGMICLDEIRGRLCEVFSLKSYKIDHVVHGAIASAAVYGALLNASAEEIESAIGMTVSHYIPWRAIRAGKQLSDSKGASAALSTEVAILSVRRAMKGFLGPKDIFRNPEAIFRYFENTEGDVCPFDLILTHTGSDFAVNSMHFKLGLYEHQSAGAIEGLIKLLSENEDIYADETKIKNVLITAYEPAFGIIGDPAKKNPSTRQSADHSMIYIISSIIRKAIEKKNVPKDLNEAWKFLMLTPLDYSKEAISHPLTRKIMQKVSFEHGGEEYDKLYPKGIPTKIDVHTADGKKHSSGSVEFPTGHALNTTANLKDILQQKMRVLGELAMDRESCIKFIDRLTNIDKATPAEMQDMYSCDIKQRDPID